MKNFAAAFLAVLLAVGLALAAPIAWAAGGKTHQFNAEFVSADSEAKTVTIKTADGKTMILRVEGPAMDATKDLKAGDTVTISCRDNDKGVHEAVVSITRAKGDKEKTD